MKLPPSGHLVSGLFRPGFIICCLICFFTRTETIQAQSASFSGPDPEIPISQYNREVIDTEDGLPGQMILNIRQSRNGYLWFGTQAGLARYNGSDFVVFDRKTTKNLLSNQVTAFIEDRAGRYWIGTEGGGLSVLDSGKTTTLTTATRPRLGSDVILSLFEDSRGAIWAGTDNAGIHVFQRNRLRSFTHRDGLSGLAVFAFAQDHKGNLWIATDRGLDVYDGSTIRPYKDLKALDGEAVSSVIVTRAGGIWAGTSGNGVCHISPTDKRCYTNKNGLIDNRVNTLFEDDHGALWIGTPEGVSRLYNGQVSSLSMREGLPHNNVQAIYEDREGSIWLGTDGGLMRLRNSRFSMFSTRHGLPSNDIICVTDDINGVIWMGTDGSGLIRYEKGRVSTFSKSNGLPSNAVYSLHAATDGSLWIGTADRGLCRFDGSRFSCWTTTQGLSSNTVRAITSDHQNNLWIGTSKGLNVLSGGRIRTYTPADGLPDSIITSIFPARSGTMWIGTFHGGISRYKDGTFVTYGKKNGMTNEGVMSLFEDTGGVVWAGTFGGGICRIKDELVDCFSVRDGLFHDDVLQILEDEHGYLWIGTMKGIGRIDKYDIERYVRREIPRLKPTVFDQADGLTTLEATGGTQPSAWRARDGRIWFATVGGVAVAHASRHLANTVPPPVMIERVFFADSTVSAPEKIVLPPKVRDLQIQYAALTYAGKKNVKFRYILEGEDSGWHNGGGKPQTSYTNLPPGRYIFRVIASNNEGEWNNKAATIEIVVTPFFYETGWFYLGLILLTCTLGYAAYAGRTRTMRLRQVELQHQVNEKTQELLEKQNKLESLNRSLRRQTRILRTREKELKTLSNNLGKEVQRQIKIILAEREHYESELIAAKDKAEESARLKSSILRNLSHEIRTPITAILGFSQVLSEEVSPEQLEFISYIQQSGNRLMDTLNSILDLSRLESHGFKFEFISLDLAPTGRHCVHLFTPMARNKGITIRFTGPDSGIFCHLDQSAIDRILNNLVGNAVKFTDQGEVIVEVSNTDTLGIISVVDTGIGISDQFLPLVFEEFKQESTGLSRSHEGSGLGLSITRKLVEAMGGDISVTSTKNVGTRFTVRFPLLELKSDTEPGDMQRVETHIS